MHQRLITRLRTASHLLRKDNSRGSAANDRGAALVEFAIAIPIFIALFALIFDAGLGYSASRSNSSAVRDAANVGARAGEARNADFLILDTLRSQYGDGDDVQQIVVYLSDPASPGDPSAVPAACTGSVAGLCNVYDGSILNGLTESQFVTVTDPVTLAETCGTAPDAAWCPLNRRANEGMFLGVHVRTRQGPAVGLGTDGFDLESRSVFAMYFPPVAPTPTPTTN